MSSRCGHRHRRITFFRRLCGGVPAYAQPTRAAISADDGDRAAKIINNALGVESDGASPQGDNERPELKYRTLGRWWWRWRSGARGRDIQWRRRDRSLWQRWLSRSLDPASPDTGLVLSRGQLVRRRDRQSASRRRPQFEKWSKDDQRIERMLWAGNSLDKAREIFDAEVKRRPRIRLTIRQRTRVLQRWPET